MAKLRFVKIEKDGIEAEVLPESVKAWERNGWTAVDDGSSEQAEAEAPENANVVDAPPVAQTRVRADKVQTADEKKENG